jgi:hypothetical protein
MRHEPPRCGAGTPVALPESTALEAEMLRLSVSCSDRLCHDRVSAPGF